MSKKTKHALVLIAVNVFFILVCFFVLVPVMTTYVTPWANEHLGTLPLVGALFQGPPIGIGMLTAGIVLSIMVKT